ncbi:MAG TPA: M20/M25/M40 family metallo-hydrolase [Sphingomicrobium sp.]|nr:M20/M25/M40 family metallo-hydrolase [Sphingomicrobium sp.]
MRLIAATLLLTASLTAVSGQSLRPSQQLARDVLKELVEINTVTATGDTAKAADAMASRLRAAGFKSDDVQVFRPAPRKGNIVARLRGTGKRKPILLLAHLDVVDAKREDWKTDPFQLVEKDGRFYGRGVMDDKGMAAIFVANLIRFKQEGFRPDRDIILVLETDEETGDPDAVGIQWLIKNQRDAIDAEYALNEDGYVYARDGKPFASQIQRSEKVHVTYRLEAKNPGGHSSIPSRDNAIYHLADALARLARFDFPPVLDEATRTYFRELSKLEQGQVSADMNAVALGNPDAAALARLSAIPAHNAQLRTTCVATMLDGGHAGNALPQAARATVSCRVWPGMPFEEVRQTLVRVIADPEVTVTQTNHAEQVPSSPPNPELTRAIKKHSADIWPGVPLVPALNPAGTSGKFLRAAGIPTYGHSGIVVDMRNINGKHGRDEHLGVKDFFDDQEYLYRVVKELSGSKAN